MKTIAQTLEVSRSNLLTRVKGQTKPRRRYHKAQDAALVPLVRGLVGRRPANGYRRITAVLSRVLRKNNTPLVSMYSVQRVNRPVSSVTC